MEFNSSGKYYIPINITMIAGKVQMDHIIAIIIEGKLYNQCSKLGVHPVPGVHNFRAHAWHPKYVARKIVKCRFLSPKSWDSRHYCISSKDSAGLCCAQLSPHRSKVYLY